MTVDGKVCVLGMWHLGSVTSACLAEKGYTVYGYDERDEVIKSLKSGKAIIDEPGLDNLIEKNIKSGNLIFSSSLDECIVDCQTIILAYDTPLDDEDNVDLSEVKDTTKRVAQLARNDILLIVQSQVPVGTCEELNNILKQNSPTCDFHVAYVPENLRLGNAIEIFNNPERIVIGAEDSSTIEKVRQFFSVIDAPIIDMSLKSAEMSKHAINAFLANCISFINELGNICEGVGADAQMVSLSLTSESRIGKKLPLKPGLGFAGGTLARDLKILKKISSDVGVSHHMIDSILKTNHEQNLIVIKKLEKFFDKIEGLNVGVLGLTYKPATNTLRRSSSLELISNLLDKGCNVKAFDPAIQSLDLFKERKFVLVKSVNDVAQNSDVVILMTDWPQFKDIEYKKIHDVMKQPVFMDMKNMNDPSEMRKYGFTYFSVGRK